MKHVFLCVCTCVLCVRVCMSVFMHMCVWCISVYDVCLYVHVCLCTYVVCAYVCLCMWYVYMCVMCRVYVWYVYIVQP